MVPARLSGIAHKQIYVPRVKATTEAHSILQSCVLGSGGALEMSMHALGHGLTSACIYGLLLRTGECFADSMEQQGGQPPVTFCKYRTVPLSTA